MEDNLKRFQEARAKAETDLDSLKVARKVITDAVEARGADATLTADETAAFRAKTAEVDAVRERIAVIDEQIRSAEEDVKRAGRDNPIAAKIEGGRVEVLSEPVTYQRGQRHSYFQDLAAITFNRADQNALDRMARHREEVGKDADLRKVAKVGPEFRDLDRNDGSGGYAVPPLWMMNRFIELARAGRAYANLVPTEGLPSGTDSINIPKLLTGTSTAVQHADNALASDTTNGSHETDLTDGSVSAGVKTIWGQQGLSIQLLEQSPIAFDDIVFRDLAADYATRLNLQVISGSGSNNQVVGVRNTSNIVTIAATDAVSELSKAQTAYRKIGDAIQRIHSARFMAPEVIVMHPRRWAAFQTVFGTDDRPMLTAYNGRNQIAEIGGVVSQQVVGEMQGLPVVTDPGLPTVLGAGTNQDVIHVLRASDLLLFESSVRARALQETRAEGLTVLLQLYGFLAFTAGRFPQSVVEIGGTALTAPTFAA